MARRMSVVAVLLLAAAVMSAEAIPRPSKVLQAIGEKAKANWHTVPSYEHLAASEKTVIQASSTYPTSLNWMTVAGHPWRAPEDQGNCGSCYAFSSVHAVHDRWAKQQTSATASRSDAVEEVVQCVYDQGCGGGLPSDVLNYLIGQGTVATSCKQYAEYNTKDSALLTCRTRCDSGNPFTRYNALQTMTVLCDTTDCRASNEQLMIQALQDGPIIGAMAVFSDFFTFANSDSCATSLYTHNTAPVTGDNYPDPTVDSTSTTAPVGYHAIEIVGYGVWPTTNVPYWTIKNSWGANFCDNGLFRIRRGDAYIETLHVVIPNPTTPGSSALAPKAPTELWTRSRGFGMSAAVAFSDMASMGLSSPGSTDDDLVQEVAEFAAEHVHTGDCPNAVTSLQSVVSSTGQVVNGLKMDMLINVKIADDTDPNPACNRVQAFSVTVVVRNGNMTMMSYHDMLLSTGVQLKAINSSQMFDDNDDFYSAAVGFAVALFLMAVFYGVWKVVRGRKERNARAVDVQQHEILLADNAAPVNA